jgi:hypothetical protein
MISHDTQQFMAQRMSARAHSYPVDHAPMITSPNDVTTVIVEAVDAVSAQ